MTESTLILEKLDQIADRLERVEKVVSPKKFLSRSEYAAAYGVHTRTIDRAIAEGRLEHEKVRGRVVIPVNAKIQSAQKQA